MRIKDERIRKLFKTDTGKSVIVPTDHGMLGVHQHLEDPVATVERLADLKVDALMINFGVLKVIESKLNHKSCGVIMTVDFLHFWPRWKKPTMDKGLIGHCHSATVEQAVKHNADAIKMLLALGLDRDLQLKVIEDICQTVSACDKYDMPVVIEPTTDGPFIDEGNRNDPEILADGCRMAVELGADIIKTAYPFGKPEAKERFKAICSNAHVPVVMLGGAKRDGVRDILQLAKDGMDAGAKGTAFGRNVWQRPSDEMSKAVRALKDIVHEGAGVEEVLSKYNLK